MRNTYDAKIRKQERNWAPCLVYIAFVVLLSAFCYSAYKLTEGILSEKKEQEAFSELSAIVVKNRPSHDKLYPESVCAVANNDIAESISIPGKIPSFQTISESRNEMEQTPLPQYLPLYEMNSEFFGWLSIEGTNIDYPVMYSPDRPEYYLEHAFDRTYSSSGVPFIDGKCTVDGNYYLIYGHHMQNKTMFGSLPLYAEQSYYNEHPVICFDTRYEQREYQIIGAFYSRVYDMNETGVFRYYEYTDLSAEDIFKEYIEQVTSASIYETGVTAQYGDDLLVLSTCNYHTKNGRFVVIARRNR